MQRTLSRHTLDSLTTSRSIAILFMAILVIASGQIKLTALTPPIPVDAFKPKTRVAIVDGFWELDGKPTYAGSRAEGLLLNVRMVNATFEDLNEKTCPKGFDPEKNTAAFIARIADYAAHGVRAFTLNLQGGSPGYEGALNSAFNAHGQARPGTMKRIAAVIEACDRAGVVVILGCFDHEQDQVLRDAEAVKKGVTTTAAWIKKRGYTNVVLEIASEHINKAYDHDIIRNPLGMRELIMLAKKTHPDLLVSASGAGRVPLPVVTVADFIMLHFNKVPVEKILERVASADKVSKAIICNDDVKIGAEGARALETTVDALCSWGYCNVERNQHHPFSFGGAADDPVVYAKFKELTSPMK